MRTASILRRLTQIAFAAQWPAIVVAIGSALAALLSFAIEKHVLIGHTIEVSQELISSSTALNESQGRTINRCSDGAEIPDRNSLAGVALRLRLTNLSRDKSANIDGLSLRGAGAVPKTQFLATFQTRSSDASVDAPRTCFPHHLVYKSVTLGPTETRSFFVINPVPFDERFTIDLANDLIQAAPSTKTTLIKNSGSVLLVSISILTIALIILIASYSRNQPDPGGYRD